ncbi:Pre-mRNA-splicing factor sap61 [Entomophthora muscae]|uniref:Pre-mRNA-splicing factor sap61 n=1 Tax=Entomophthora muscae TaxID=34485 RepID=A0ACC2RIH8_9FUNG|nr:Pre-mRNA-splicing factor sap61 [Entomophthora muscae]
MNSILEIQRQAHEDIEILEQGIVDQYHLEGKTQRDRLVREHQVSRYLETMTTRCGQLHTLYEDPKGERRKEIEAISGANEFSEFYLRLKDIKDYHRRNPYLIADVTQQQVLNASVVTEEEMEAMFSGEESNGKFLDLHASFEQYINLKHDIECTYLIYLDRIDEFSTIPRKFKGIPYRRYLDDLKSYLESFFERAQPLIDYRSHLLKIEARFEEDWKAGQIPGWRKVVDDPLFCKACNKNFAKQSVFDAHLTGKRHLKALKDDSAAPKSDPSKTLALLEMIISSYLRILGEVREETKANVERKQSLTEREREIEQEVEEVEIEVSDSDDEERIYNPLKLPLGWDGKPIPYWLYKLHGLGVEYPCEICGNYVYMGRKAFERHFQEWRHGHGMRCLGIPNTRHFNEITSIEDAYSLWERLKQTTRAEKAQAENLEEFEDQNGNVFNRKTYEDLRRQGLL